MLRNLTSQMGLGERREHHELEKRYIQPFFVFCAYFSFLCLSCVSRGRRAQMGRMCDQLLSINFGNSLVAWHFLRTGLVFPLEIM